MLLSSCSTKLSSYFKEDTETAQRNDQLMKSFKVDDNVLSKFKEEKKIEEPKKAIVSKSKTTPPKKAHKKKTKKKIKKKVAKKVLPKRKKLKKKKVQKSFYPNDFPEKFKAVDITSKKYWPDFNPLIFPNEEIFLDINYMGVSTGKIAVSTLGKSKIGDQEVFHLKAQVKTAKFYRYLYELDDNLDSYVTTDNFVPVKYSLIQRESGQNIDDLQLFDHKELKTYTFYKRETKKKTKKSKGVKFIPKYFQDPLSVLFFLRGLPMVKGNKYNVPVINKGKLLLLKANVIGVEKIKTKIGTKEAYKVQASTSYSGDTLKSGKMTFWFSTDDRRIFLKFKAKIKIGAISGDIEKYSR
tara:strand:+ start:589 stop:1647 length:1059 start_codon:yes stop_codon:yes gene_type:complete